MNAEMLDMAPDLDYIFVGFGNIFTKMGSKSK